MMHCISRQLFSYIGKNNASAFAEHGGNPIGSLRSLGTHLCLMASSHRGSIVGHRCFSVRKDMNACIHFRNEHTEGSAWIYHTVASSRT